MVNRRLQGSLSAEANEDAGCLLIESSSLAIRAIVTSTKRLVHHLHLIRAGIVVRTVAAMAWPRFLVRRRVIVRRCVRLAEITSVGGVAVIRVFRQAMAAPAALTEFKGNVTAVLTETYWDPELDAVAAKQGHLEPVSEIAGDIA